MRHELPSIPLLLQAMNDPSDFFQAGNVMLKLNALLNRVLKIMAMVRGAKCFVT